MLVGDIIDRNVDSLENLSAKISVCKQFVIYFGHNAREKRQH